MNMNKNKWMILPLALMLGSYGCSSDDDDTVADTGGGGGGADTGTGTPDSGTATPDSGPATDAGAADSGVVATPDRPALAGTQVDRAGRAAINPALIQSFNTDITAAGMRKDAYNGAPPANWTNYSADIAGALGIYDSLDLNCGNQFAAATGTASIAAGAYDALAGVLADDRLYVNTATGTCGVYLGVEANATGIIPNGNCGGRQPADDVIEVTYSALAIGGITGVDDTVVENTQALPATFPYLAAP
jgi:hypothetical protein